MELLKIKLMKNYSNKSYIRELVKMCCLEISFVKMTVL